MIWLPAKQLQKWKYQNSKNKSFLFLLGISFLCLSFPYLLFLLILHLCTLLLPLSFSWLFSFFHLFICSFPLQLSAAPRWSVTCFPDLNPSHVGCMTLISVVRLRSISTLLMDPAFAPRVHYSPSHHLHRWASSSHTGRWTGTCAPQSWDHGLHPPFQKQSFHLVPARIKKKERHNQDELNSYK